MTYSELYKYARDKLTQSGNESSVYETRCLMYEIFGTDRLKLSVDADKSPEHSKEEIFLSAIEKRVSGIPLQYILGKWTFMERDFFVGEGVLIPRDDTEVAVRTCMDFCGEKKSLKMIDLCSGSGIIAVTLALEFEDSEVTALELEDIPFDYLKKNVRHNQADNVITVKGDIFTSHSRWKDGCFDLIVSNPPYIRTNIIPTLQKEVQYEPKKALDGGDDGLMFYRCIAENWIPKLKKGGKIVLEIGEEQAKDVCVLLKSAGIAEMGIVKDIQELDRVVFGTKVIE